MKNKLLLAALSTLAFVGCDKEDSDNKDSEKATLLAQQTWRFQSAGFDLGPNGSVDVDISSQLPPCLTDNTITFTTNGNGTVSEGATKCDAAAPPTTNFTWSFAANETVMNINGNVIAGSNGGQFKIVTLNSTNLTLSKDTVYNGIPGALVASFQH